MNLMTEVMNQTYKILKNTDAQLKKMATEPYATRKMTAREHRERIQNLTPADLISLIEQHGEQSVNDYIGKYGGING